MALNAGPSKIRQIPSHAGYKALNRGTLGDAGSSLRSWLQRGSEEKMSDQVAESHYEVKDLLRKCPGRELHTALVLLGMLFLVSVLHRLVLLLTPLPLLLALPLLLLLLLTVLLLLLLLLLLPLLPLLLLLFFSLLLSLLSLLF